MTIAGNTQRQVKNIRDRYGETRWIYHNLAYIERGVVKTAAAARDQQLVWNRDRAGESHMHGASFLIVACKLGMALFTYVNSTVLKSVIGN